MERLQVVKKSDIFPEYFSGKEIFEDKQYLAEITVPHKSKALGIGELVSPASFVNCTFSNILRIINDKSETGISSFINCVFENKVIAANAVLNGKLQFINCEFRGSVDFKNATFNNFVDFSNCKFYLPTTFYRTSYKDVVDFSSATFKENILFTYTLIQKLMILRGANPEKGFDLSLAIIAGELNVFNFEFDDYIAYREIYKDVSKEENKSHYDNYLEAYATVYEDAVSRKHLIPLENKRETYRILKNQLETQKNYIDSIPFRVMENKTLLKESYYKLINGYSLTRPLSNIIVLSLNAVSNWFGSSYIIGLIFTVSVAAIFFNLALSHIGDFVFTWNYENWQWRYFVQFINPTHRTDYMRLVDENPRQWFFIWDFIGRIFIGYGIYQTIQAFRKYK